MSEEGTRRERVVVIGAGPVGLAAALACQSLGLDPLVVEADPDNRTRPGSRAIFLHAGPLSALDALSPGIAGIIKSSGILWKARRYSYRGREFYIAKDFKLQPEEFGTSIPQTETERLLLAELNRQGTRFRWGAPVTSVVSAEHSVKIVLLNGKALEADYVIAADGARSPTRKSLGLKMEGRTSESRFVIVDLNELPDFARPSEIVFDYEHPGLGRRNVLFVPFQGGWRVDVQLHARDDETYWGSEAGVREWIPKIMDPRYSDRIRWVSTYRFHQLLASEFADRHRRVLLTGEAAHLFPPFGGRGLNSGIMDATGAARAISHALQMSAGEACREISAFEKDRREAAEFNSNAAGQALDLLAPQTIETKVRRRVAMIAAPWSKRAAKWLALGPSGALGGRPGHASIF
jgi:3-(3-hydroxy-phenyl)propionate hydroxylase